MVKFSFTWITAVASELKNKPLSLEMNTRTHNVYITFWERLAEKIKAAAGGPISAEGLSGSINPKILRIFQAGASRRITKAMIGAIPNVEGLQSTYDSSEGKTWLVCRVRLFDSFHRCAPDGSFDSCCPSVRCLQGLIASRNKFSTLPG